MDTTTDIKGYTAQFLDEFRSLVAAWKTASK